MSSYLPLINHFVLLFLAWSKSYDSIMIEIDNESKIFLLCRFSNTVSYPTFSNKSNLLAIQVQIMTLTNPEKVNTGSLVPIKSKVVKMMLTSRMQIGEEHQKIACDTKLANYMDHCPEWLKAKDDSSKNWMDLDNKMTETIAVVRAIGAEWFLIPDEPEQFKKCEEIEKILFSVMNTMVYLINKICFAPNSTECNDFDVEYARSRFLAKFEPKAKAIEEILTGPFIMGNSLPVHADYLLYACLYDIKVFCPNALEKHAKLAEFMEKFWNYPSPIRRWFRSNESKTGEYIRPSTPHIMELLPEDQIQGDIH